jgi:thiol:disulfide interchange protein DsbD
LEKARLRLPVPDVKVRTAWGEPTTNGRPLTIEFDAPTGAKEPEFFPLPEEGYEVGGATEVLTAAGDTLKLRKLVKLAGTGKAWPTHLNGVLTVSLPDGALRAYEASLPLGGEAPATGAAPANGIPAAPAAPISIGLLLLKLAAAFVGGLILNIMPCVLPVLSLKILGFVSQGRSDPRRVRHLGLVYGAGVLASFLALALAVLAVNAAGGKAVWGMQLQSAAFVVVMTTLVLLIALNLFGVFEVMLGGGAITAASSLARREGPAGAFFNGVLATALATPCTAPFLGAAVGFAFTQSSSAIILVTFLMVGLGMAFPYVLLSWHPAWLQVLPRPGAWMERFKKAMGFPMLATAAWLFSLAVEALGPSSSLWLALFLVMAALAAWIWGEFGQRDGRRGGLVVALVVLAASYGFILEHKLQWRSPPVAAPAGSETFQLHPGGIVWRHWSPGAVAAARAEKRPVLVDFTASWCLTCQVNVKTSLEIESVRKKLEEIHAVALLEDSFKKNAQVVEELNRHGRAGVPLVLVYPRDPAKPPLVLPEILTPSIVLEALAKAAE